MKNDFRPRPILFNPLFFRGFIENAQFWGNVLKCLILQSLKPFLSELPTVFPRMLWIACQAIRCGSSLQSAAVHDILHLVDSVLFF